MDQLEFEFGKFCRCDCHKDGKDILHFDQCCLLTYQKYINRDGSVDRARLFPLYRENGLKWDEYLERVIKG